MTKPNDAAVLRIDPLLLQPPKTAPARWAVHCRMRPASAAPGAGVRVTVVGSGDLGRRWGGERGERVGNVYLMCASALGGVRAAARRKTMSCIFIFLQQTGAAGVLGASWGPFAAREGSAIPGRMERGKEGSEDGEDGQIAVRMRREGPARGTGLSFQRVISFSLALLSV